MSIPRIVTTSWDDGNRSDLKVAELLRTRGVNGTFYIPVNYGQRTLDNSELRNLASEGFEIGAHGLSHQLLWGLSGPALSNEIGPCKPMLEDIIGQQVPMFCYPCGRYNANVIRTLREHGYRGARTTRMLATQMNFDPFEIPTTIQGFPHLPLTYLKNAARARRFEGFRTYLSRRSNLGNWIDLGKRLFDDVLENGGIWHLYGHSWELDRLELWNGLGELLDYVSRREGVQYVPNCELVPFVSTSVQ